MDQKYKFDLGKVQYRLVPPKALEQVARVLTFGATKYSPYTWKNVEPERYLDAAYRHLESVRQGKFLDEESGLPHLAMAITNIMFLLEREFNDALGEKVSSYYQEANRTATTQQTKSKSHEVSGATLEKARMYYLEG